MCPSRQLQMLLDKYILVQTTTTYVSRMYTKRCNVQGPWPAIALEREFFRSTHVTLSRHDPEFIIFECAIMAIRKHESVSVWNIFAFVSAVANVSDRIFFCVCWPAHTDKIHNLLNYRKIWVRVGESVQNCKMNKNRKMLKIASFSLLVFAFQWELWSSAAIEKNDRRRRRATPPFSLLSFYFRRSRCAIRAYRRIHFIGSRYLSFICIFDFCLQPNTRIRQTLFWNKMLNGICTASIISMEKRWKQIADLLAKVNERALLGQRMTFFQFRSIFSSIAFKLAHSATAYGMQYVLYQR